METEGKAKVVASFWGAKFVQFLAALAVLPQLNWKKRTASAARNRTHSAPQTVPTTFALSSISILLLCLEQYEYLGLFLLYIQMFLLLLLLVDNFSVFHYCYEYKGG